MRLLWTKFSERGWDECRIYKLEEDAGLEDKRKNRQIRSRLLKDSIYA